jgi:TPR repeat protein
MRIKTFLAIVFFCLISSVFTLNVQAQNADSAPPAQDQATDQEGQQPGQIRAEVFFASMLVNAEKGQSQAMLTVGVLYEQGIGVPRNFTKALEWYQKASLAGESDGYFRVGLCYEIGMGIAYDMDKAVSNFEKAVEMGSLSAAHKMASLYLAGQGVAKDEAKGLALLTTAADGGNGAAANELAYINLEGLLGQKKDPAKAKALFIKGAETGNLEAIKNLAVLLKDGIGEKPNPALALYWYLIAQTGGYQAPDLDTIIGDLKKSLTADQAKKAEADADKWIAAFAERNAPQAEEQPPQE